MAETSASRTAQSGMVTGLFPDRESAERAYGSMVERGYGQDDVNLVMSDETRKKHFAVDDRETELGSKALEGAGTGAAIGGAVGATLAAIAAIGTTLALPGLGLLVAGPIAAAFGGSRRGRRDRWIDRRSHRCRNTGRTRQELRRRNQEGRNHDGRNTA